LAPDRGIEIDCRQIMSALPPPAPPFVKGYVVIESDIELDVVAVYSTAQSATATVNSFHTERVEPRCVPVCEDLVLPLHTGVADWRTISPTVGPVVTLANLPSFWAAPPFGSSWVSQTAADSSFNATPGLRRYDLCFDLCFGYTVPPRFDIQLLTDNQANVFLNGNLVGATSPNGYVTPTTLSVNPQFLGAGRNCFWIDVTNGALPQPTQNNPTGFALAGLLRVARGKCPCSPLPLLPPPQQGGGLPTGIELAADESEVSPGGSKVSRKGSKKSQSRKRAGKKTGRK
jgi:hypothetical protein